MGYLKNKNFKCLVPCPICFILLFTRVASMFKTSCPKHFKNQIDATGHFVFCVFEESLTLEIFILLYDCLQMALPKCI